jgi:TetR/AcrR family transcriptional regulator, transcriptional repressor for nem operon
MAKNQDDVYARMIKTGLNLFRKNGYANTGLQEIINKSKTSKGGFYYYFKSKEDFAIKVIEAHTDALLENLAKTLESFEGTLLQKVKMVIEERINYFDSIKYVRGSLLAQLLAEASERQLPVLKAVNESYERIYVFAAEAFAEAQQANEINKTYNPKQLTVFMYSGLEGALLKARAEKSKYPLMVFQQLIFGFFDSLKTES